MNVEVRIVSKTPPGGRCELYARMLFEIVKSYANVYYTLIPADLNPEQVTPPLILVSGTPVHPEDGVMLTPPEVLRALEKAGAKLREGSSPPEERLWELYEEFLSGI